MAWSTFWIVTQMIMVQKWQKNVTFCIKGALSYIQNYGEEDEMMTFLDILKHF